MSVKKVPGWVAYSPVHSRVLTFVVKAHGFEFDWDEPLADIVRRLKEFKPEIIKFILRDFSWDEILNAERDMSEAAKSKRLRPKLEAA